MKNTGVRIYIIILSIITVFCIIIGATYHMGTAVGRWLSVPIFHIGGASTGTGEAVSAKADYDEAIEKIEIDGDVMNLTVTKGDKVSVSYDGIDKLEPTVAVDDGVMTIKQPKTRLNAIDLSNIKSNLSVTLPEEGITALNINVDVGNIDITGIIVGRLDVNADTGDIEGNDITAQNASFDADVGNIQIKSLDFKDLSADADVGNIQITTDKDLSDYDIELSADLGHISFDGKSCTKEFKQNGSSGSAHMDADVGNVELN